MTEIAKTPDPALDRLWKTYLEVDISTWEPATHKKIGDNLRCYPVVVAFAIAVIYLWNAPAPTPFLLLSTKIAAALWSLWVFWYACLTVMQTVWLFANFWAFLIGVQKKGERNYFLLLKLILLLASAVLSGFFMWGAVKLGWLIYTHAPKYS